ncbi:class I SAM-dependent methyltransferase [Novosphingobium sp.]|uniref:class I SAM-dependent methyltransferase n=1 Tax=Novosphingobium sp. TaxID=1874826 RepID=UPI0038BA6908
MAAAAPKDDLRARFARLIATSGPISIAHYIAESNARYYASRDPLGVTGDFTTAPEISQMFGEMVGVWLADIWQRAGGPAPVAYVELGPGRGTLARDALRVMERFGLVPQVHLVEGSPALRAVQAMLVPQAQWHDDLSTLPDDLPLLVVANEFLDALPVRQLVRTAHGWRERMVGWDGERLLPVAGDRPMDAAIPPELADLADGAIVETSPAAATVTGEIARRLAAQGGAALLIDYGHAQPRIGSTLQAVRAHAGVDPFAHPGEADLTAHVDFAALVAIVGQFGSHWLGTVTQGAWLQAMGIEQRAQALAARFPSQAEAVAAALQRLVAPDAMGDLFKVMGLAAPPWPDGAGFA